LKKIYSGTQFFNELDMLEIRLETMSPYVDYFVISESVRTHAGNPKPLFYKENQDRYKRFHNKIIHQIVDHTPLVYDDLTKIKPLNDIHEHIIHNIRNAYWLNPVEHIAFIRDAYEKECISLALEGAADDDIIIIGDLDEIPRPEALEAVLKDFNPNENYLFQNEMFYMYLNLQKVNEPWWGVNVLSVENMLYSSISKIRQFKEGKRIGYGGWHFTYMGGEKAIIQKLESFSHQEFNNPQNKANVKMIVEHVKEMGLDALGRPSQFLLRDIRDGTFPQYVVDNTDKFEKYILK